MKALFCSSAVVAMLLSTPASAAFRHGRTSVSGVVNLNQANTAQLHLLPGVGAKAAQSIVDYRGKHPFNRPEELVNVKGFGKKRFDRLKPYLAVQGVTTLHKNAASSGARSHTT